MKEEEKQEILLNILRAGGLVKPKKKEHSFLRDFDDLVMPSNTLELMTRASQRIFGPNYFPERLKSKK